MSLIYLIFFRNAIFVFASMCVYFFLLSRFIANWIRATRYILQVGSKSKSNNNCSISIKSCPKTESSRRTGFAFTDRWFKCFNFCIFTSNCHSVHFCCPIFRVSFYSSFASVELCLAEYDGNEKATEAMRELCMCRSRHTQPLHSSHRRRRRLLIR